MVDTVSGHPSARTKGLFERALKAGIPFTPAQAPWWDLAGPVRDYLAALAPVRMDAMSRAAEVYRSRGELGPAFELLLASGDANQAAAVLGRYVRPRRGRDGQLRTSGPLRPVARPRRSTLTRRSSSWSAAVSATSSKYNLCCQLLDHAQEIATRSGDVVLYRAAAAELAKVRQLAALDYAGAEVAARQVLASAGPDEQLTRARANEFLGFALCRRVDSGGRHDEAALAEAEECFARASQLYLGLGRRAAASFVLVDWTVHIDFPRGQFNRAMDRLEQALRLVADRPTAWGFVMIWRAMLAASSARQKCAGTASRRCSGWRS